jgi:hypothetical protein
MKAFAAAALSLPALGLDLYLCPEAVPTSIAIPDADEHLVVMKEGVVSPLTVGCVEMSVPKDMHYFLAHAQKTETVTECSQGDYFSIQLSPTVCLAATEDMEALHNHLYDYDFMAVTYVEYEKREPVLETYQNRSDDLLKTKAGFTTAVRNLRSAYNTALNTMTGASSALNINTRCSYSTQHTTAANWIRSTMAGYGGMTCSLQPFRFGSTNTNNVLCIKTGRTRPSEVVVVGGHYDSTSDQCSTNAPGAVDNGSGCTMTMMLARAAASYSFDRTIHFICFGGEEQGLFGSQFYVQQMGRNVRSALTADMIAYSNRYYGVMIEGTTNAAIQTLMNTALSNLQQYSPNLSRTSSTNSFGSDHVSFQRAGIPAILYIERDDTNYPCYHRTCDTMQYVNLGQSIDITVGVAGALWDEAGGR